MQPSAARTAAGGLSRYRFALHNLVLKDFRVRYRNMSLGFLWSLLNPLIMLGVLVFVFSHVFKSGKDPLFPIFLLIGIIAYNFFSLCVPAAAGCIIDNASIVKKLIFPRLIIPLSVVLSQMIHLAIQLGLLGIFLLVFRVPLTWSSLWMVPVLAVELAAILGISLIASALNVYFRDMQYLIESGLRVLFWFTPIFYPLSMVRENAGSTLFRLYLLNPLAGCINAARRALLEAAAPDWAVFGTATGVSLVLLVVGLWLFTHSHKRFADYI